MILSCQAHFPAAVPGVLHWGSNHGKWFKASSRPIRTDPSEPDFASSHIHFWPLAGEFPAGWLAYLRASYESTECQKRIRTGIMGIPTALSSQPLLMSLPPWFHSCLSRPWSSLTWIAVPASWLFLPHLYFYYGLFFVCFFKICFYCVYVFFYTLTFTFYLSKSWQIFSYTADAISFCFNLFFLNIELYLLVISTNFFVIPTDFNSWFKNYLS